MDLVLLLGHVVQQVLLVQLVQRYLQVQEVQVHLCFLDFQVLPLVLQNHFHLLCLEPLMGLEALCDLEVQSHLSGLVALFLPEVQALLKVLGDLLVPLVQTDPLPQQDLRGPYHLKA